MKHSISLKVAKELTKNFRSKKEIILKDDIRDKKKLLPICETFDRAAFDKLLSNDACKSVRVYFGMDLNAEELVKLIIVGVDENGNDILMAKTEADEETPLDDIIEDGQRCPDTCPPSSPLSSEP